MFYFLFSHTYAFTLVALGIFAYGISFASSRMGTKRLSFLAVFSVLIAIVNPVLIDRAAFYAYQHGIVPLYMGGTGPSGLRSFVAGLLAVIVGIDAILRIHKAKGTMHGRFYAFTGIVIGGLWAGGWAILFLAFTSAMSKIH